MYSSAVTSIERNMCCFGCDGSTLLYKLDNGQLLHRVTVEGYVHSVDVSSPRGIFWTGTSRGVITAWNIKSAAEEWSLKVSEASFVIYMERVVVPYHPFTGALICGTGRNYGATMTGEIAIVDEDQRDIVKMWSTELECLSYCYHAGQNIIASGHCGVVKLWELTTGELLRDVKGGPTNRAVRDMSAHPRKEEMIFVIKTQAAGAIKRVNLTTGECSSIIPVSGHFVCKYDQHGERILCMNKDNTTIQVHDESTGNLLNRIVAHSAVIYSLNQVPDSSTIVTAGRDGGMRSVIPSTPDLLINDGDDDVITFCALIGEEYATLSVDGLVAFHDALTHIVRASLRIPRGKSRRILSYPGGAYVFVTTGQYLYTIDSLKAEIVFDHHVNLNGEDVFIRDIAISPSGSKCVIVTTRHGVFVYDTSDVYQIRQCSYVEKFEGGRGENYCADIHVDNKTVVSCGQRGIWLWDIDSTQIINTLRFTGASTSVEPRELESSTFTPLKTSSDSNESQNIGKDQDRRSWSEGAKKQINTVRITSSTPTTSKIAKFVYNPGRIVYHIRHYPSGVYDEVRIMNLEGVDLMRFNSSRLNTINPVFYVRLNGQEFVTAENDGSIKVYDTHTGSLLYIFLDQRSQSFKCFVETSDNMLRGFNTNGTVYQFLPALD